MRMRARAGSTAAVLAVAAGLGALAGGCGSTTLVNMWKDSSYAGPQLHDIFVMSAAKDPSRRRIFEDAFCTQLAKRGVSAVPCYRVFPDDTPSEAEVKEHITAGTYDGLIVAKRVSRETRQNYVPGYSTIEPVTRYNPWWGTWGTAYREVHTPGYVETETAVRFETLVYGLKSGESAGPNTTPSMLLWTGTSETIDPTSPASTSGEISRIVIPELVKAKIIP